VAIGPRDCSDRHQRAGSTARDPLPRRTDHGLAPAARRRRKRIPGVLSRRLVQAPAQLLDLLLVLSGAPLVKLQLPVHERIPPDSTGRSDGILVAGPTGLLIFTPRLIMAAASRSGHRPTAASRRSPHWIDTVLGLGQRHASTDRRLAL